MEKKIIIELHDVSPFYRNEFFCILKLLYEYGIKKFSLLVIPNFRGRYLINKDSSFINLIKYLKQEAILHGLYHSGRKNFRHILSTTNEGEFINLTREETEKRIKKGKKILEKSGIKTNFFVAPAWLNNKFIEQTLIDLKFQGIGNRWSIKLFNKRKVFSPVITLSNRKVISYLSKKSAKFMLNLYSKCEIIRLSIHMQDANDEEKMIIWKKLLEQTEKRRLISYEDLISKS